MTRADVRLPPDLAAPQRERVLRLVAECGLAVRRHDPHVPGLLPVKRCHGCQQTGGRMGGHHLPDETVVWIHKSCHRKLHRAGRT